MRTPRASGGEVTKPASVWPFALSSLYVGDRVDVRVGGALDTATAPLLRSVLANLADDGHFLVTLDLSEVDVMDAAGARAVAYMAARLRGLDARLTIRGASAQVRDTLRLGALDSLIDFQVADHGPHRAVETDPPSRAVSVAATLFLKQVGVRARPFAVVDAALRLVTSLAHATVDGADGVSVSLHRRGALVTVAASDDRIAQMDRDQYATGQGPCLSAAAEGRTIEVRSLDAESRWPDFVPLARRGGIASILSSPLASPAGPVGALNMYSKSEGAFGSHQRGLATLFAEQASGILAEAGDDDLGDDLAQRLHDALLARSTIAQAQGILMAREGVSAEEAYADLRQSARSTERSVREEAEDTIAALPSREPEGTPDG